MGPTDLPSTRPITAPRLRTPRDHQQELLMLLAELRLQQIAGLGVLPRISDAGMKVYSQHDDDGIIQYLLRHIPDVPFSFIEFGTEDYEEANTRFLVMRDGRWRGLLIDGDPENIAYIIDGELYWRYDLRAISAHVTRDNINQLFAESGFTGQIGILSIDVDGVDYWLWDAITVVSPIIVIIEYNAVFGATRPVTVPYDPTFQRTAAHYSNLYFGASLSALCHLAARKGYALVGTNSTGNNAYFVRRDRLERSSLRPLSAQEGYVTSVFRESIDPNGVPTFLSGEARRTLISHMPVVDVTTGALGPLGEAQP